MEWKRVVIDAETQEVVYKIEFPSTGDFYQHKYEIKKMCGSVEIVGDLAKTLYHGKFARHKSKIKMNAAEFVCLMKVLNEAGAKINLCGIDGYYGMTAIEYLADLRPELPQIEQTQRTGNRRAESS